MLVGIARSLSSTLAPVIRRGSNSVQHRRRRCRASGPPRGPREAAGNFVLVFAFGVAIATHTWFAPLLIGAPLVAMVNARNRASSVLQSFAVVCNGDAPPDCHPRRSAFWLIQSGSGLTAATLCVRWSVRVTFAVTAATVNGCTLVAAFALELDLHPCALLVAFDLSTSNTRTATHDDNRWPMAFAVMASAIAICAATMVPSIPTSTALCLESSRGRRYGSM